MQLDTGDQPRQVVPTATETAKGLVTLALSMLGWDHARLDPKAEAVRRYVIEQYPLLGRAPSRQEIASALQCGSANEVQAILERLHELDILYLDPESREIRVAYPFSSVPTKHLVCFPGWDQAKPVYAPCAADALGIPFMLRRDVSIASSCAHCAKAITIKIRAGVIVTDHPAKTVVWAGTTRTGHAATSICPTINFFCSSAHAEAWRLDQRDAAGHVLSLGEALYLGKGIFEDLLNGMPPGTSNTTGSPRTDQPEKALMIATSVGGIITAFLASVCCIGPLVFAALGVGIGATGFWAGTAGFLKTLLSYRPWFIGTAGLCFALSFYLVYRKPVGALKPGAVCHPGASTRFTRRLLWTLAVLALVFILSPYWLGALTVGGGQ
jgi:mercuric ion transport protein